MKSAICNLNRIIITILLAFISSNLSAKEITVVTTIHPISLIISSIIGTNANITVIGNVDAHHEITLKPSEIKKIKNANIVFHEGIIIKNLVKKNIKNITLVDLSTKVKLIKNRNGIEYDKHFWLDPSNAIIIAKVASKEIIKLDPDNKALYVKNTNILIENINHVDHLIKIKFEKERSFKYIVMHDAYQYFEKHFNLHPPYGNLYNVDHHINSAKKIKEVLKSIRENEISCIISESKPSNSLSTKLGKNTKIIVMDPLGKDLDTFPKFLHSMAKEFLLCTK